MKKKSNIAGKVLIAIGVLLVIAALIFTGFNIYENIVADRAVKDALSLIDNAKKDNENAASPDKTPDYMIDSDIEMPTVNVGGIEYIGTLEMPTIGKRLPVISNWSYDNLHYAPCRYSGSAYKDNLVICGHNYVVHFGPITNLGYGDSVIFTDVDGNVFRYKVAAVEILDPDSVEKMTDSGYPLSLFTCTLSGATRATVRCEKE